MKLRIPPPQNTYDVLIQRWDLSNAKLLVKTKRSAVFKVDSPKGPAALKLYNEIGYGSERAAIAFSNNLHDGIGARILNSDYLRAAVLSEWISGPNVAKTYHDGGYVLATRYVCEIATKISRVRFRWAFAYRKLTPLLRQRLQVKLGQDNNPENQRLILHAIALLDSQFGDQTPEQIIHGDLHYGNIILTPHGPRVIDPKGVKAHPLFEFRNTFAIPKSENSLEEFTDRILRQVSILAEELGYSHKALIQFNIFQMISSMQKPNISAEETEGLKQRLDVLMGI